MPSSTETALSAPRLTKRRSVGGSYQSALTLELLQRIEQLEAEVRQIRGELEIYRHRFDQLQQESARAYAPPTAPAGAAIPPPQAEPSPAGSPPADTTAPPVARTMPSAAGTAQADFEAALRELREGLGMEEDPLFLSAYTGEGKQLLLDQLREVLTLDAPLP